METHPLGVDVAHGGDRHLHLHRYPQQPVAHAAPGGESHLRILQVERRGRERAHAPGVVVMQVRQHDVLHGRRVDPHQRQRLGRGAQQARAPRVSASAALDPVSTTIVRPPPVIAHTK